MQPVDTKARPPSWSAMWWPNTCENAWLIFSSFNSKIYSNRKSFICTLCCQMFHRYGDVANAHIIAQYVVNAYFCVWAYMNSTSLYLLPKWSPKRVRSVLRVEYLRCSWLQQMLLGDCDWHGETEASASSYILLVDFICFVLWIVNTCYWLLHNWIHGVWLTASAEPFLHGTNVILCFEIPVRVRSPSVDWQNNDWSPCLIQI